MDLTQLTEPPLLYLVVGLALVVVTLAIWLLAAAAGRRRERDALRERFGPEYDRAVAEHSSNRAAVADLREREALREGMNLRQLNDADRDLLRRHMAAMQYRFVEDPTDVVLHASRVVTQTLRAMGYPIIQNRDRAVRMFSVDYPEHAATVRSVLDRRERTGDVDQMRTTFLNARDVLRELTGVSYTLDDARPVSDDELRIERNEHRMDTTAP